MVSRYGLRAFPVAALSTACRLSAIGPHLLRRAYRTPSSVARCLLVERIKHSSSRKLSGRHQFSTNSSARESVEIQPDRCSRRPRARDTRLALPCDDTRQLVRRPHRATTQPSLLTTRSATRGCTSPKAADARTSRLAPEPGHSPVTLRDFGCPRISLRARTDAHFAGAKTRGSTASDAVLPEKIPAAPLRRQNASDAKDE